MMLAGEKREVRGGERTGELSHIFSVAAFILQRDLE